MQAHETTFTYWLQSCILHELHFRYRFLNSIVEVLVEKGGRIG